MSYYLYTPDVSEGVRKKIRRIVILAVVCFLGLWGRIWYLQILKGVDYKGLSESNRVRMVSLPSFRGKIMDRRGETLVSIRPSFNLFVTPEDTQDLDGILEFLSDRIPVDTAKVHALVAQAQPFENVLIDRDLDWSQVAFVEENNRLLPGVKILVQPRRDYVQGALASHVLGYLGEISRESLTEKEKEGYRQGDLIGKEGIELLYENQLKGRKGYKEVEVDVAGRELGTLRKLPPQSGNQIMLTLDLQLQKLVEELMQGTPEKPINGAIVVMKVQTGEVLAISSKPSFDPNLFASGISREDWNGLIQDARHPLQNRAIDGQYPPGSVYKIVTAYAGLEEHAITPDTKVFCSGNYKLGRGNYRCWKRGGHGHVNLHDALVQSCDVYFYTLGYKIGINKLAEYARDLGLGQRTRINLIGEKPGLVPTIEWKERYRKERWQPGETISASIGQGFNLVTPIQQVAMLGAVANGGMLVRPYIVKQIKDHDGRVLKEENPKIIRKIKARKATLETIRKALLGVVHGAGGTGGRARLKHIKVAGKTGTAQVVRMKPGDNEKGKEIPYEFRDHAWFVAFAPFEHPEIAVSVIVEHGGHGGATAAPLAKKIIEAYHKMQNEPVAKTALRLSQKHTAKAGT